MRNLPWLVAPALLAGSMASAQTPTVSVSDVIAPEGDHGFTPFVFTVSLSEPSAVTVRVKWSTERCTAIPKEPCSDGDYIPDEGTLRFAPGETAKPVEVSVIGDTLREGQEVFFLALSHPENAVLSTIPQGQGQGIILNDDGPLPASPAADFNGDGRTDIVWRHRISNRLVVWLMDGLNRLGGEFVTVDGALATAPPDAELVGTADFDGDGDADLLFQPSLGKLEFWLMDGTARNAQAFTAGLPDPGWRIVGTGRFNGDGHPDLLWRHETTGRMQVWFMDGLEPTGTAELDPPFVPSLGDPTTPDLNWRVAGLGDFNGDGKSDLLFRHALTERMVFWLMDGVHKTSGGYFTPDRPLEHEQWDLARVWDVDQDGITDLVFRHEEAGTLVGWFMNDRQERVCGTYFNPPVLADLNWIMAGPR